MSTETKRPPIVAVMGHIDHGKSSLLDYIRKSNVVAGEAGGITQHVSAYEAVHTTNEGVEERITFLDTPGHEAFQAMRSCGASIADIAILVVAADDGVKPQTLEALQSIKEANIPYVVALTKSDKPEANIERAKTSLLENEIYLEGLGGDIPYAAVSSKTGDGIPDLLELIVLSAELLELKADPSIPAEGIVLESSRDPKRGDSATLVIKNGSLTTGSFVVAGHTFAPVRFIENFAGERIETAGPSQPVRIVGFSDVPPVGSIFTVADKKKDAEQQAREGVSTEKVSFDSTVTTEAYLPLIIKADVLGSIPAIEHELKKLQHEHISYKIIAAGVGAINEGDIKNAIAAPNGVVVGFHTSVESAAADLADRSDITAKTFDIIYELSEFIDGILTERAPRVTKEVVIGRAKILKLFNRTGSKQVLGARVQEGEIKVDGKVRIHRRETLLGEGKILNMQSQRSDVDSVREDTEFGAQLDSKIEPAPGDIIEAYELKES